MPLGVLAVDIDKLLQNRITIPSAARDSAQTPTNPAAQWRHATALPSPHAASGPQRLSSTPRGGGATPRSPSSKRKADCYLIKGDDGTRVWNGVVVPPAQSPKSSSPATTPRRKHQSRRIGGTTPRGSDNGTPFRLDDVGPPSEIHPAPHEEVLPFSVEVAWSPRDAHSTVRIIPSPRTWSARDHSYQHSGPSMSVRGFSEPSGTPAPIPTSVLPTEQQVGGIMVAPRPGSGSSIVEGGGSRKGSAAATRQGSARTVRVIDHHEEAHQAEDGRSPRPPLPRQGNAVDGNSVEPQISSVAQDIIDTTLNYVKGRMQLLMHPPPPPIPKAPSMFPSRDVEGRLLAPKKKMDEVDGAGPLRRRVSHHDMIASADATCRTDRQRDMCREKERNLANASLRHENIFQPQCRSLPSTLSSFRPSIHGKKDPMFPAVFDLEYVKPSRVVHAHKSTADRKSQAYDTISPAEKQILDVIARSL